MNRLILGIPDFAKMRRALLASVLGLGLVALWPSVAFGKGVTAGPEALLDSATDDGDGRIRVSWSLSEAPEDIEFLNDHPDKVCVSWAVVENGERGSGTETCFTSEASSEADLVVDTGIGGETSAEYAVLLLTYYNGLRMTPSGGYTYTNVTLNDEDDEDENDEDENDEDENDEDDAPSVVTM